LEIFKRRTAGVALQTVKFLPAAKVKLLCSEVASRLAGKFLFLTKVVEGFKTVIRAKGLSSLRIVKAEP